MDQDRELLEDRLSNLERQISVFERMVHMLSGSLDHRFKRYDMVICSQQQQISELNAVLSTFLNDEYRHAEVLREKLTGTLHGISATAAAIGNDAPTNGRYIPETARSLDPDNIFSEILGEESPHSPSRNHPKQDVGHKTADMGHFHAPQFGGSTLQQIREGQHKAAATRNGVVSNNDTSSSKNNKHITGNGNGNGNNNGNGNGDNNSNSNNNDNNHSNNNNNNGDSAKGLSADDDRPLTILSYGDFDHLPDSAKANSGNTLADQTHFFTNPHTNSSHVRSLSASDESDRHVDLQVPPNTSSNEMGIDLKEEQYITNKGRKRKRSVYVGSFQFLKSPHSVMEVWKEYTEGMNGQPSIREMETIYQTGWRRDPAVNKRYSRRKVLCKAIETGLERGYSLDYIINLLEDYRYINREKGLKQPIGWICQGQNIPESLRS